MAILKLLQAARWLTTGQIRKRFFSHASADAARKRLRKLTETRYLVMFQEHRMTEALFTLGREGKRVLEKAGSVEIHLERIPPKQLEHFIGINDLRIAAELSGEISYFFACWELPKVGWEYRIIPDAVFAIRSRTFAAEFDRGAEGVRYFLRTKMAVYRQGLDGLSFAAVLVVADRKARMESLSRAIGSTHGRVLYTTIDLVRKHGLLAPIFFAGLDDKAVSLV